MWAEDLADNPFVVLLAYVLVGIPLNWYLYHDVIDRQWRTIDEIRWYSKGYAGLACSALVLLCLYGLLQVAAEDYKEAGAAFLSCAIAVYGLYLYMRQTRILRFVDDYLQPRADAIASVYEQDQVARKLLFSEENYKKGKASGRISSSFLDDNYPGEGPRVTWLSATLCKGRPEVKDWPEMAVRTGLWIRLAVASSRQSFDTALRPYLLAGTAQVDTSRAWTFAIIHQCFEGERYRSTSGVGGSVDLNTFHEMLDGEEHSWLSKWKQILSRAPESEWKEALAEFKSDWTEKLQEEGVAFEVYLTLALHPVKAEEPTGLPGGWPICAASQSLETRDAGGVRDVEEQIHDVLSNGFVTSAVLMAGFPRDESKLAWLKRVRQLAEVWHRLAESTAGDTLVTLDRSHSVGVDLVVALALLLDVNNNVNNSFDFSSSPGQGIKEALEERQKHVVRNIQGGMAETLLKESLRCLEQRNAPASDIAQAHYSLGKFLQDLNRYAEAHDYFDFAITTWENPRSAKLRSAFISKADMFVQQRNYREAEQLYKRAAIHDKVVDPDDLGVAEDSTNMARLLTAQAKYAEAQPLFEAALAIRERVLGGDHPDTMTSRAWMADLYTKQGLLGKASPLLEMIFNVRERGRDNLDVASALNSGAEVLKAQGMYAEAEPLYERSQAIREEALGPEHHAVATVLNNRALLAMAQAKYPEAELLYKRSLAIRENVLGTEHPDVATVLNNQGELMFYQGKYTEAELVLERSQAIREKALGLEHPDVAESLNNRAGLLESQGKYDEADRLYVRVLHILAATVGEEHLNYASTLNNRAGLLKAQGKYEEAEPLYERSQTIREKVLGPHHPDVAQSLNNRALLLSKQGKYEEAEPLYERSQTIREKVLGPHHPDVAQSLNNRAGLLESQGKYDEADPLYLRAIEIGEKTLGPDHPDLATTLNNRALLLEAQGKYDDAEPLYERAQAIREKVLGPEHPDVAESLNNRAVLLKTQGKYDQAGPLYERSLAIREKVYGPDHPAVATALNNRALLLSKQGKYNDAEPLCKRAQAIREKVLGPEHPDVAQSLNNRAGLLYHQGKYDDAEPLYERSQAIREKVLGLEHPDVAQSLNNRAWLLESQCKHNEALPLVERAVSIRRKTLGESHHSTVDTRISLERVRKHVFVNTRLGTPGDENQAGPSS